MGLLYWPGEPGKPYRPSNGTEGMSFHEEYCGRCQRDNFNPDKVPCGGCSILRDTLFYDIDSPHYPKQWRHDTDGVPYCSAFVPRGDAARKAWATRRKNADESCMFLPFMLD